MAGQDSMRVLPRLIYGASGLKMALMGEGMGRRGTEEGGDLSSELG
jgi:hypothetical protein